MHVRYRLYHPVSASLASGLSVAEGGRRTALGEVLPDTNAPRLSTDGTRVTFDAAGPGSRGCDIYIADLADVGHPRKVISNGTFPVFSSDGEWLAFRSLNTVREGGEEALFMQRADGSGEARLIVKAARAPENWRAGEQGFHDLAHLKGGPGNSCVASPDYTL